MKSLEFISENLAGPLLSWRDVAAETLFEEAVLDDNTVEQLSKNLLNDNLDIVEHSLKIIFSLSYSHPSRIISLSKEVFKISKSTNHFYIIYISKKILKNLLPYAVHIKKDIIVLEKKITPHNFIAKKEINNDYIYRCEYGVQYTLGAEYYKHRLEDVCVAFEYDCSKAIKKIKKTMKDLGYKKGDDGKIPTKWRREDYYSGREFRLKSQYYAHHSIQFFLMWCIENCKININTWNNLLEKQDNFDPSLISKEKLVIDRPNFIKFPDATLDVDVWLKKKTTRVDVYDSVQLNKSWITLLEYTSMNYNEKEYRKNLNTCFVKTKLSRVKDKKKIYTPYYVGNINHIDDKLKSSDLYIDNRNANDVKDKLFPTRVQLENYNNGDNYLDIILPAPEIIKDLKLRKKKNTLDFYKEKELVVQCINWQGGYTKNLSHSRYHSFDLSDYGTILIIKTKYLKLFLKKNKLRLLTIGEVSKKKAGRYEQSLEYRKENVRDTKFIFEISKAL